MTDGTEHPPGAAAPGSEASSVHGSSRPYPPQAPRQQAPPFAQPGFAPPRPPFVPSHPEPDWQALADRNAVRARRRKLWTGGAIAVASVAAVAAVAAGTLAIKGMNSDDSKPGALGPSSATSSARSSASSSVSPSVPPSASLSAPPSAARTATPTVTAAPTPSHTRAPVTTPTVPGKPNVLADHSGQANLPLGPDAGLKAVSGGYALSLKGSTTSYAQSTDQVVDAAAGFTVSAWVYNDAADGSRSAISEGDGTSSTFDLGRDDSNGQKAWVFRVQTAGSAGASTVRVSSGSAATVSRWTLLTGSYDAAQHTIRLYVNGTSAGSAKVSGLRSGSGPLELGRSRHQGTWAGPWGGVIGHIQVWDKALSPAEAARVKSSGGAGPSALPIASWLV